jgi:tRNA(Arg) A34 adenosine deaminase TadA
MSWAKADVAHMQAALAIAGEGVGVGEVPVGAVVTFDGAIIGAGHNATITAHDPSAHAEIVALRAAANAKGNHRLPGATLYVTLEPCAMCMGAIAQARVSRVVFGAYDPKAGAAGSVIDLTDSKALNHRFEINGGLLADECGELLQGFFESRR